MTKYGRAAVKAVKLLESDECQHPKEAWKKATSDIFGEGNSGQEKGCPRNAFLGLCEEGVVKGVEAGDYCYSNKNKNYVVNAVSLLRQNPDLAEKKENYGLRQSGNQKLITSRWMWLLVYGKMVYLKIFKMLMEKFLDILEGYT